MSKPIFSFLLFLFTISLYAQEKEVTNGFTFALEAAPEFGPKSFERNNPNSNSEFKNGIGFTSNFIVTKYLFNNIHLKSGIGYKNKNTTFNYEGLIFGSCIDPISGIVLADTGRVKSSLHYIFIPIGVIYELRDNFKLDIGLDIDLLVHEKDDIETLKDPVLLNLGSDAKKVLISFFFGTQIKLNDNFYLKPFVNTRYENNKLIDESIVANFDFTIGLKGGWVF